MEVLAYPNDERLREKGGSLAPGSSVDGGAFLDTYKTGICEELACEPKVYVGVEREMDGVIG